MLEIFTEDELESRWWIGLHDQGWEGRFRWVEGSWLGYADRWSSGEPNDHGSEGEDCAELYRSKINDNDCPNKNRYVCQIRP